ncbi:Polysaccharide pyruvyl transferase [Weeksella virosa]|uniref:polysaccharide pyruvyl transferase family protein n=1 Tax=Weeksella virosa TaxID=1014 RepID=UPI000E01A7BD|nr:polysaccharide pyruvyl transferase family protein [Weeksella virosa]SUP53620.1 Polysaccharide pyruvyl transferase [Weeksella virosa]
MLDLIKYHIIKLYYSIVNFFSPILMYWFIYSEEKDNFGDMIGPYLIAELSNLQVKHVDDFLPKKYLKYQKVYLTVGSILYAADSNSIIWGSGIIDSKQKVNKGAKYLAVRGPRTRRILLEQGNICPEVYGDPALLLPLLYKTSIKKENQYTIIPHYVDYDAIHISEDINVDIINLLTNDFNFTLDSIIKSNLIISSSLHGLIIAVAYNIPCIWVKFSDKLSGDDIKFYDFFDSLGLKNIIYYKVENIEDFIVESLPKIPPILLQNKIKLTKIQQGLLRTYPFKIKNNQVIK